jgi:rubredoxin
MSEGKCCSLCGYNYDPQAGDPAAGIAPGTPFDALPDSWRCPRCGAEKSDFLPLPTVPAAAPAGTRR